MCYYSKYHLVFFFFFNDTATTEIYTLSLHAALPISDINGYRDWRNAYWITGEGKKIEHIKYVRNGKVIKSKARHKVPSSSTMNTEETVLRGILDRKSTRLNSSHKPISYAVFCLKKKTSLQIIM